MLQVWAKGGEVAMIRENGTFILTFDGGESMTLIVTDDAIVNFLVGSGGERNQATHIRVMKSEMRDALRALLKVLEDDGRRTMVE